MLIAYREITRRWWWWVTLYGVVRNTLRMKIRKDKERKKHEPKRNRDDANPAYPSFLPTRLLSVIKHRYRCFFLFFFPRLAAVVGEILQRSDVHE